MVDTNNPGHLFILSGACVLMYGLFGLYLYPNATPSDHADQRCPYLWNLGIIVSGFGAAQFCCAFRTYARYIGNRGTMPFIAFLSWSILIGLIMLTHQYLVHSYEMGWGWRNVVSVLSTLPWVFTVGKQFMKHREMAYE